MIVGSFMDKIRYKLILLRSLLYFLWIPLHAKKYTKKSILRLAGLAGENIPTLQEDFFIEKDIHRSEPTAGEKEQKQVSDQAALEEQETAQEARENKPIEQQSTEYKEIPLPGLPEYVPEKPAARISEDKPEEYLQEQQYSPEQLPVDMQGLSPEEIASKKEAEAVSALVDTIDRIFTQYNITIRDLTIGLEGVSQENYKKITNFLNGLNNALVQNSVFDVKDTILHAYEQYGATIEAKNFGPKNSASAQAWQDMTERLRNQNLLK